MWLLLMAVICAQPEPIPPEIRKYFELQETDFEEAVKRLHSSIKSIDALADGESASRKKSSLQTQAKKLRTELESLEEQRFQPKPDRGLKAGLGGAAYVGQIGTLPECKLKAAVDGVPVMQCTAPYGRTIVLTDVDAKSVHPKKPYRSDALWIVRAVKTNDENLKSHLEGPGGGTGYYFVEKLDRKEVVKWRAQFDEDRRGEIRQAANRK
jgi:hypothetical protein